MTEIPNYDELINEGITYCDTPEKAIKELWRLRGMGNRFSVDTETKTLDPHTGKLRLVQIADVYEKVGVFDTWKIGDKGNEALAEFIENREYLKIFHHAKFDIKFLRLKLGIKDIYPVICTLTEAAILACGDPSISRSLENVVVEYLGISLNKSLQTSDWTQEYLSLNQIRYAAEDAKHLMALHRRMFEFIRKNHMEETFRIEMNCVLVTAEMEINGMPLNFDKWCARADSDLLEAKKEQRLVYELCDSVSNQANLFGEPASFNLNYHQNIKDKMKLLGIPIPTVENREGIIKETTGKDQLKEIEHLHPFIQHLLTYRQLFKSSTTYGRNWAPCINPVTKRVHANLNQNGSETARYTTGEEVSDSFDPPMLGIPRADKFRNCFEASEGRSLVWGDYSQIELRILADFANDTNLLQAFIDGRDPHLDAAVRLFGLLENEITSEQRHLAKDLNYAIPYGVGWEKFALKGKISEERAKELMEKYFAAYPGVKKWLDNAGWRALREKQCRTASGRLLKFRFNEANGMERSMAKRNGKNAPIQGTCSDIIKVALFETYKETRDTNILICHVFHDEIILECPNEDVPRAEELLGICMVNAGKRFLKRVPVKVDIKSGRSWGK